jgi:hypothetical protein
MPRWPALASLRFLGMFAMAAIGSVPSECPALESATAMSAPTQVTNRVELGEVRDGEQVMRIYLASGTNMVMLVAPTNTRIVASTPGSVTLSPSDSTYVLVACFTASPTGVARLDPDATWVNQRFVGAEQLEESSVNVLGNSGKLFTYHMPYPGMAARAASLVILHTQTGVVELSLIADPRQAKHAKDKLHEFMLSLRTDENGNIQVSPIPTNS